MPCYVFECKKTQGGCGETFETVCSMSQISELKPKCPACKKSKFIARNYRLESPLVFEEVKTLGMYAEKRGNKMSKDEKDNMTKKHNEYKTKRPDQAPPPGMKWGKDLER